MAAVEQLITENLDVWSSAIKSKSTQGRGSSNKIDLYGIQKLRELILDLAVRGLLVPQNFDDEPASVLLERISNERKALVEQKKIKKPKRFIEITKEETPFDLPAGWEWTRLSEVGHDWGQKKPEQEFTYIDVGAINKELGFISEPNVLNPADAPSRARKIVKQGTVIYSTVRPYLLNIAVIDKDFEPEPIASTAFAIIHPFTGVRASFIYRYLRSPAFIKYVESCQTGVAYPAVNDKQFFSGLFPMPPESEQPRIEAKVNELMALCDQLEQQQENSISAHQTLVETLLNALVAAAGTSTQSADKTESSFDVAWARIAEHFDTLFTTEHSIDQLKQTLLQLAVMGKLVPQNPIDEPASVLLEKIAAEKAQLIKDKKIKKPKPLVTFAGLDELKVGLPESWAWIRLSDTADIVRGGSPRPAGDPRYYDGDIPFLKVGDVTRNSGKFVEGFNATIKEAGLHKTRLITEKTVLLSNSGATLGIPAICDFDATFNDGIAAFVERSEYVFDEYLYLYLKTLSKWFLDIASRGQGQPNLNTDIIKSIWFGLPPENEQKLIVKRVDELFNICDQLKSEVITAKGTQLQLADAIGQKLFGNQLAESSSTEEEIKIMKISTQLTLGSVDADETAVIAPLVNAEDGYADAKAIWAKTNLELPEYYKQLKKEIELGYIAKPAKADFE